MADNMVANNSIDNAVPGKSVTSPLKQFMPKDPILINEGALIPTLNRITSSYYDLGP